MLIRPGHGQTLAATASAEGGHGVGSAVDVELWSCLVVARLERAALTCMSRAWPCSSCGPPANETLPQSRPPVHASQSAPAIPPNYCTSSHYYAAHGWTMPHRMPYHVMPGHAAAHRNALALARRPAAPPSVASWVTSRPPVGVCELCLTGSTYLIEHYLLPRLEVCSRAAGPVGLAGCQWTGRVGDLPCPATSPHLLYSSIHLAAVAAAGSHLTTHRCTSPSSARLPARPPRLMTDDDD